MKLFVCVLALLISLVAAQENTTIDRTACSATLTEGSYSATFSANQYSVKFEVSADTSGWVAIGFSEDTFMSYTDVILGASDGTDSFISDRYTNARAPPPVDASQDITAASVEFMDGTTTIRFTRSLYRNDYNDDISLEQCVYFLYAWGGTVGSYSNQTLLQQSVHTNKGSFANRICIPNYCVNGECPGSKFTCGNGDCISNTLVCDGSPDCDDQSDESSCGLCSPGEFQCDSGQCTTFLYLCDGTNHCGDMSDENNCSCPAYQFTCGNGDCISNNNVVCDGSPDCYDRSDESNCDTCYAMESVKDQLSILKSFIGSIWSCHLDNDCTEVDCGDLELILQPCYSPPAIQLKIEGENAINMFHTFTKTEAVSVTIQDSTIIMKITLNHMEDAIGLQVDVFKDGYNSTVVQYTEIPLNLGHCSGGETGKADTCNAMESVANNLILYGLYLETPWSKYRACTKDSDCSEIACEGTEVESGLKLTILPCYSPPAIQLEIVYKDTTYLDHTFTETEEAFVTVAGVTSIIRVTLYHPDESSILLRVSVQLDYDPEVIIRTTMIPLDTSGCPALCSPGEFQCDNGQCIDILNRCDINGVYHCDDLSDENNCPPCNPGEFQCDNGQCIDILNRCDINGVYHCDDLSDENNCPCTEFTCDNGDCISNSQVCDGSPDCDDQSDESNCSDICFAMQDVGNQLSNLRNFTGSIWSCHLDNDCTKVDCGDLELILQPCYSPPAIQLKIKRYEVVDMLHTFTKSEAVSVTIQGSTIVMQITLDHLEDAIGLQVGVLKDGHNSAVVQYTEIPLITSQCSGGETGKADTCNAMESIANNLILVGQYSASWSTYRACTKDSDCSEIACEGTEVESGLKLTILPCYSPPAIQLEIIYRDTIYLDRTFTETEVAFVTIAGVTSIIRVTLYHPDKSSVLLQVSVQADYDPETIIPITIIPLDSSGCPGSDTSLKRGGDGSGGDDSNGVVVGLAVGVPVLVLCCVGVGILVVVVVVRYRKKSKVFEFKMHTFTDDSDKMED